MVPSLRARCPRCWSPKVRGAPADGVGVHGRRGLRLSPDQRPWQLPLRVRVRLLRGGGNRWGQAHGVTRGVNQAGACGLDAPDHGPGSAASRALPGASMAGKSVRPSRSRACTKTPLLAVYAAQGRGPDLTFGSRLGDERAWCCGLVIAPYLPVAYRQRRHADRQATGPVRAPLPSMAGSHSPVNGGGSTGQLLPARRLARERARTRRSPRRRPSSGWLATGLGAGRWGGHEGRVAREMVTVTFLSSCSPKRVQNASKLTWTSVLLSGLRSTAR